MPVTRHACEDHNSFKNLITNLCKKKDISVVVLFTGAEDKDTGKSWCCDCEAAQPFIEEALKALDTEKEVHFIKVEIERSVWKGPDCVFRNDPKLKLKFVPTLIKWNAPEKLEEAELTNKNLLQFFFQSCLEN